MAGLLPSDFDDEFDDAEGDPRVVGVDTTDADEVLGALSSETARRLLTVLHEESCTPSQLAERADTSLQNTQYHLDKLADADLIEVKGTRYSAKGREMNVYAPTDGPLVLFAGDEEESAGVQAALAQLLGGVGILSMAGGIVKWWITRQPSGIGGSAGPGPHSVAPSHSMGAMGPEPLGSLTQGATGSMAGVESVLGALPSVVLIVAGALMLVGLALLGSRM